MAYESILTPEQIRKLKAIDPRGANLQGVDRERSNPNRERIAPVSSSAAQKEQSSSPIRRDYGPSREREAQAGSPPGDRKLQQPPASPVKSTPFSSSDNILKAIADRFNIARENGKAGAWKQLQTDLMNASPFICPTLIPYKDLIQIVADIEKEIKGSSSSQVGKSNEELMSDFLSGKGPIAIQIKESLDTPVRIDERDGEPPAA